MRRRAATLAILILTLLIGVEAVIYLGGTSSFDLLGFALVVVRMLGWILVVSFYYPLAAALGDDDLQEDYARINDGNVAVAVFRGLELAGISFTAAMLISKI